MHVANITFTEDPFQALQQQIERLEHRIAVLEGATNDVPTIDHPVTRVIETKRTYVSSAAAALSNYRQVTLEHLIDAGLVQTGAQVYLMISETNGSFDPLDACIDLVDDKAVILHEGRIYPILSAFAVEIVGRSSSVNGWKRLGVTYNGTPHTLGFLRRLYCEHNDIPHRGADGPKDRFLL